MIWDDIFSNTFKTLRKKIEPELKKIDFLLPSMPMVNVCRSNDFDFFHPLIESGDLTISQMHHAANRYYLGKSKSGKTIFWMIDEMLRPLDGHLGDSWVSSALKSREPLLEYWKVKHCLFGLHLLESDNSMPISIVESEQSAVLLSELLPDSIWMAYAHTSNLSVDLLEPLQGRTVTIYPRTDPTMSNYVFFLEYADLVRRAYPSINLSIDTTLEDRASPSQKSHCIDLLDFLLNE